MIAMLVEIDGQHVVSAGVADWSILPLHVDARRGRDGPTNPDQPGDLEFSVGGLTERTMSGSATIYAGRGETFGLDQR